MKRAGRIGTIATASLVAVASLGASQPPVEEQSQTPTEQSSLTPQLESVSTERSETPLPEVSEKQDDEDDSESTPYPPPPEESEGTLEAIQCDVIDSKNGSVTIEIPDAAEHDLVEVGDTSRSVDAASQVEIPIDGPTTFELTLWHGENQPAGQCTVQVSPEEPTSEPSDSTPTPAPSDSESDSETSPTPDPPTGPSEDPTTPTETPSTDTPGSVAPPPPSQAPSDPPSSPQQTAPAEQAPPASAPSRTNNRDNSPQNSPEPTQRDSSQQSEPEERNIRQYSQNPRHLLSQLLGTDSHNGSRLIMPRPRDAENESPELETLPPVSEDELNAIKARHSAPENGNGLGPDDELVSTDGNTGLSTAGSVWLWSGGTCTVLVGLGIWWALSRRKPQH